jgi:hypothetical protein
MKTWVWLPWLLLFFALWITFYIDEEWKYHLKMKYQRCLQNITRLEKWHDEHS